MHALWHVCTATAQQSAVTHYCITTAHQNASADQRNALRIHVTTHDIVAEFTNNIHLQFLPL